MDIQPNNTESNANNNMQNNHSNALTQVVSKRSVTPTPDSTHSQRSQSVSSSASNREAIYQKTLSAMRCIQIKSKDRNKRKKKTKRKKSKKKQKKVEFKKTKVKKKKKKRKFSSIDDGEIDIHSRLKKRRRIMPDDRQRSSSLHSLRVKHAQKFAPPKITKMLPPKKPTFAARR